MAISYGFCLGADGTKYSSKQFSEVFQALVGDGVYTCKGQMALTAKGALSIGIPDGYAIALGRWVELDEEMVFTVNTPDNLNDRYDCAVVQIDLDKETADIKILPGTPGELPKKHEPERTDTVYELILGYILVKKGATAIVQEDIEDTRPDSSLCGLISPFSDASNSITYVYDFLKSGIDDKVSAIIAKADGILVKGDEIIAEIKKALANANVSNFVGDISISSQKPIGSWLHCDGTPVPQEYPELSSLLSGTLPNISFQDERVRAWIYAD